MYGKITTYDTVTYCNKAKTHKDLYSGLRLWLNDRKYNELGVSFRIIKY